LHCIISTLRHCASAVCASASLWLCFVPLRRVLHPRSDWKWPICPPATLIPAKNASCSSFYMNNVQRFGHTRAVRACSECEGKCRWRRWCVHAVNAWANVGGGHGGAAVYSSAASGHSAQGQAKAHENDVHNRKRRAVIPSGGDRSQAVAGAHGLHGALLATFAPMPLHCTLREQADHSVPCM
jgi:hypothetical protein